MPKTITSPVTRFPGTVLLHDPLPLSAVVIWEEAQAECSARPCPTAVDILRGGLDLEDDDKAGKDKLMQEYAAHFVKCADSKDVPRCRRALPEAAAHVRMLPAIRACVAEWHIEGFDLANPPGSPKASRVKFMDWLIGEIQKLYVAEEPDGDPNASRPEPSPTA
jgi:hypothetical protein